MRLHCILLIVVAFILAGCPTSAASVQAELSRTLPQSTATVNDNGKSLLRGDEDGEERAFNDELINKYLHLFEGWARNNQTPENLFLYLGLPRIMKKAYIRGRWDLLLQNENFIMYRKYEKYLHLLKNGEH